VAFFVFIDDILLFSPKAIKKISFLMRKHLLVLLIFCSLSSYASVTLPEIVSSHSSVMLQCATLGAIL